ncbi:caspase family protein [Streptomyces coeruleoprunus]|uniref:Caspase family protein n=1 Tax=Streptomyces coeruleoprunus TaxID=285563 RepID=A0ABV9X7W9_9ACTN
MRTVYALFVGIDDYPGEPLRGCLNDVRAAENWLRRQSGPDPDIRTLHDAQATRAAVIDGITGHLGRGGPGDTALLWFSGHGTERPTDDPREATGMCQALVCHDSLHLGGQPLLQDTELGALLDAIAARGTHVLAVLDCCHAGGATRDTAPDADGRPVTARGVTWRPWWTTAPAPTPGSRDGGGAAPGPAPRRHVLLAACRPQERAHETVFDGLTHGYFSHALLHALDRLGPTATYGTLHARVEALVRDRHHAQHPELHGPEDRRFLYGDPVPGAPFLLRHTAAGWEVDCGQAHGLRTPGAEFALLPPHEGHAVAVREVRPETALVTPVGGRLPGGGLGDRDAVYAVTPSALAFPPATVTAAGDPEAVALLTRAVGSPWLTPHDGTVTGTGAGLALRVDARDGRATVSGGDGHPLDPLPLRTADDARHLADRLAHIARWHHIRDLTNPDPWLSSLVRVTVDTPLVGTVRRTADGETVCAYTPDHREPQVMVRVHNDWTRPLWCVLLDLTDGYASSPHLYEGDFVGPGRAGLARRGEPVWLRLPPGRAVERGAFARDWLKVIVAENELNVAPFRLPPLAAPGASATAARGTGDGGLLRLAPPSGSRDAGGPARRPGRWGTAMARVRTEVP